MVAGRSTVALEAINRIVEEAAKNGGVLLLSAAIEAVMKACPDCRPSERYLKSEILIAATSAMVAVEMDRQETGYAGPDGSFA